MTAPTAERGRIPRLPDDYTRAAAALRMEFLQRGHRQPARSTSAATPLIPSALAGNIENFVGAAQVPIGLAGPLLVDGEHARGEFYVPLATTEGTLVASYNRGMKLLHRAGGVRTTVMDDVMQRAPAFGFDSAQGGPRVRRVGQGPLRRHQGRGRGDDHQHRAPARHRAVHRQQVPVPAVQLHHRRCRRAEHGRQGHRGRHAAGSGPATPASGSSLSSPTWPRTRRARRSTSCAPAASGSPRRRRIPAGLVREIMHTTPEEMFRPARSPTSAASCPA